MNNVKNIVENAQDLFENAKALFDKGVRNVDPQAAMDTAKGYSGWAQQHWLLFLPYAGSFLFNLFFGRGTKDNWYKNLKKPSFHPPSWFFSVVWPCLYFSIGKAMEMVWENPGRGKIDRVTHQALSIGINLVLNWLWSPVFFKYRKTGLAVLICGLIFGSACLSAFLFSKVNYWSGLYLIPYCIWTFFATILGLRIHRDNKPRKGFFKRD